MCIRDRRRECRDQRVLDQRLGNVDAGPRLSSRRSDRDHQPCLLYTSDAADERSSVDLGGRRIIKKKNQTKLTADRDKVENKDYKHMREQ